MNMLSPRTLGNAARLLLILISSVFVLTFIVVAIYRLAYPYELEWMEGASVDHVMRLLSGQPLYTEPSIDFVPLRYTPFYYYVTWFVSLLTGAGFVPLRLVSIASAILCFAVLFQFIRRETNSLTAASAGVGFLAATYPVSGDWFDVGRCDMLFIALLLWGLYLLRFYKSERGLLGAALLFSLSYLTKQVAAIVIVTMAVYLLAYDRRRGVLFVCGTVLAIVATSLALEKVYNGWYSFYTFELGSHIVYNGTLMGRLRSFLYVLVFKPFPIASILGLILLVFLTFVRGDSQRRLFYWFASFAMTTAAFLLWINAGSYYNNLIPQHVLLALLFGCGIGVFLGKASPRRPITSLILSIALIFMGAIQLFSMKYSPQKLIPSPEDRRAGDRFVNLMRSYEGDILVPFHGYIPSLAGKPAHAHRMAMQDLIQRTKGQARQKLLDSIRRSLDERRFSAIIVDHRWFDEELRANYDSVGVVFTDTSVFWPVTGWRIRPTSIFIPKSPADSANILTDGNEIRGK